MFDLWYDLFCLPLLQLILIVFIVLSAIYYHFSSSRIYSFSVVYYYFLPHPCSTHCWSFSLTVLFLSSPFCAIFKLMNKLLMTGLSPWSIALAMGFPCCSYLHSLLLIFAINPSTAIASAPLLIYLCIFS